MLLLVLLGLDAGVDVALPLLLLGLLLLPLLGKAVLPHSRLLGLQLGLLQHRHSTYRQQQAMQGKSRSGEGACWTARVSSGAKGLLLDARCQCQAPALRGTRPLKHQASLQSQASLQRPAPAQPDQPALVPTFFMLRLSRRGSSSTLSPLARCRAVPQASFCSCALPSLQQEKNRLHRARRGGRRCL